MTWQQGHEKMITFGAALEVRGTTSGVWCYRPAAPDERQAAFWGVPMTWEEWSLPIIEFLDRKRTAAAACPQEQRSVILKEALNTGLMMLFYQHGCYMTLTGDIFKNLKIWLYEYLYKSVPRFAFPYQGAIPDGDYSFVIDFAKDTETVRAYDLKTDMAAYNKEHNAAHNKELGRRQTLERFKGLRGDEWTTQEIFVQGFSEKNIKTFVKHGLIRRDRRGHYVRNSV